MQIEEWAELLEMPDRAHVDEQVGRAIVIGKEKYGSIVGNLAYQVLDAEEMRALISALVVGNIAFDAQAAFDMEVAEGFHFTLKLEKR